MTRMLLSAGILLLFILGMLLREGAESWATTGREQVTADSQLSANSSVPLASTQASSTWRRTKVGWEDSRFWNQKQQQDRLPVHPVLVALLQLLLSVGALLWFETPDAEIPVFRQS
jgi:hypothetical protein